MLSKATIIGRNHRLMRQNCQDFSCVGAPSPGHVFGLVLDGCGSKYQEQDRKFTSHNEVGAKLLGAFAGRFLAQQIQPLGDGPDQATCEARPLLQNLYGESLAFLDQLMDLLPDAAKDEQARFIATHLLTTLLGFLITPQEAVFFWMGDGYVCHDAEVYRIESDNRPDYLAYRRLPGTAGPLGEDGFQIMPIDNLEESSWLAVATDGWRPDLLRQLSSQRNDLALKRWMNVAARRRGHFDDDGAVAVWWRNETDLDRKQAA